MNDVLTKSLDYLRFGVSFFVLQRDDPFVLGLVTNDTCNLDCIGCRVANVTRDVMSMEQITSILERYHAEGVRMLYLSGGEPYLWRDGKYRLPDVVQRAREIGYLRIHVYTNGTARLSTAPDFTWVSIDGFGETFETIRGIPIERVLRRVRGFRGRHAIIFTINTVNYREIRATLEFLGRELPGVGVMFFFHTPYYGIDYLHLSRRQRTDAVETLLDCKKLGFPVLNSKSALRYYLEANDRPPLNCSWIVDSQGAYRCCRVAGESTICRECGYSTGLEIAQARKWKPDAIATLLRTH